MQLGVGGELGVAAEHDVGAAAGHVGGDGDGALAAGLGDDRGLLLVVLGVEHLVRDTPLAQQHRRRAVLGLLDADVVPTRTGWPARVALGDVVDDRLELGLLGLVDDVGWSSRTIGLVGRDLDDAELVDLLELGGLGQRRAGHPPSLS